jgi:twitching motility protein PilT
MELAGVLKRAVEQGASDVHLVVGRPPLMRQDGGIRPVDPAFSPLAAEPLRAMIYAMLRDEQRARF